MAEAMRYSALFLSRPAANNGRGVEGPDSTADNAAAYGLGPICDFTNIVSLKVQDKTFYVHKDILTKDSAYFEGMLDAPSREGQSQSFTLNHNPQEAVAEYIRILQQSVYVPEFKKRRRYPARGYRNFYLLVNLLTLWQLSGRFLDMRLREIVEESMDTHWKKMSIEGWSRSYLARPNDVLKDRILRLQEAYKLCKKRSIPFEKQIITACANCPPQIFAEVITCLDIEAGFQAEVVRNFALRHADLELTRKRKAGETALPTAPSAKKRRYGW